MSICDIGGSEQYVYNKLCYLKQNGYDVLIFSGLKRKILINDFKQYSEDIIPNLMYAPCFFTKRERKRVLERIVKKIKKNYAGIYIETDGIDEAKWGELLARRLRCKSLIYNVQEKHNYTDLEIGFLKFKCRRNELFGINDKSVNLMLKDSDPKYKSFVFKAFCNNVVYDCEDEYSRLLNIKADYTVGSIGRLEKECVPYMLDELLSFFKNNNSKTFNLVLVGGSEPNVIKRIKRQFSVLNNVNLIITGTMYPIPRKLIQNIDVFVSTAGSANVSYFENKPTIKIHPISGKPCGVIGESYDFFNGNMYNTLEGETICSLLQNVLSGYIVPNYQKDYLDNYETIMNQEFDRQLRIIQEASKKEYYNIAKLNYRFDSIKHIAYYVLGKTLGGNKMQSFLEFLRRKYKY